MIDSMKNIEEPLKDLLGEPAKKSRKALLFISILAILFVRSGILPTKIENMGIQFTNVNQEMFLQIISFVLIYFWFSFAIYAWSDLLLLRLQSIKNAKISYDEKITEIEKEISFKEKNFPPEYVLELAQHKVLLQKYFSTYKSIIFMRNPVMIIKTFLDFIFPLFVGLYAIVITF